MMGFEAIGNLLVKRAVSALVKRTITDFNVSSSTKREVKLLIKTLKEEIELEIKRENSDVGTGYRIENLHNYYKLAQAYEKQEFFEDMSGSSKQEALKAVDKLELRLGLVVKEKEKAVIYNYLADFYKDKPYEDKSYEKFETYNLEALEYKDKLEEKRQAKIFMRQALSEMNHEKYEDALTNIESAIEIEPFNSSYLALEIEILLHLNRLDNLLEQIERNIDEHKQSNDVLSLADDYILMAKYWGKKQKEDEASEAFKKAYELIKEYDDELISSKKIYLLSQISVIHGDEDNLEEDEISEEALAQAREAVRLISAKNFSLRGRLDFIEMANSLNSKGVLLLKEGKYKSVVFLLTHALEIRENVFGESHPETATSYNNLAELYWSIGEYEKALPLYKKALKIWEEVLGESHPSTATSYNNLAGLYRSMGEYEKALTLYKKALKIREEVLGESHPDTAKSYNGLALLYKAQGDFEKAYSYIKKAIEIRERVLPVNHPDLIKSKKGLEMIEERLKTDKKQP